MKLVVDMEADGLLDEVTKSWCIVAKDIDEKYDEAIYYFQPDQIEAALEFLSESPTLIMHNGIGYDMPVLKKLYGFEYSGELIDTLVVSRLQYPDRPKPEGYVGKATHSVESYGVRFGIPKPEHEDWSRYTPEMLYRCKQDVLITEKIYNYLLEERKR